MILYLLVAALIIFIVYKVVKVYIFMKYVLLAMVILMYVHYFAIRKGYDFLELFGTSIEEMRITQMRSTWHYKLKPGLKNHKDFAVKIKRIPNSKGTAKIYAEMLCNDPDTEDELCSVYIKKFYY